MKPPGRLVDVGGFRLHLLAAGPPSGRPVVVLDAALAATYLSWCRVQPAVSAFARVCAYDRGGLGWSEAGPLPRTAGRLAGELRTLLERAGEPPPYLLVGHSFGGLVVRLFAARWPGEIAGLVLVDPAHPEDWVRPAAKEQALIDRGVRLCGQGSRLARLGVARAVAGLAGVGALGAAWRVVTAATGGALTVRDEGILAPMWKLPPEARRPLRLFWTQPRFFDALGHQIGSMPVTSAEVLAASAGGYGDLPLVTISSTDPGDHRLRQQKALAGLSTRGRHLVASASGHWIPLDQPDLVVHVIREMWMTIKDG
jgi:pimeloyl-ACP methyl ester carboxylesterase